MTDQPTDKPSVAGWYLCRHYNAAWPRCFYWDQNTQELKSNEHPGALTVDLADYFEFRRLCYADELEAVQAELATLKQELQTVMDCRDSYHDDLKAAEADLSHKTACIAEMGARYAKRIQELEAGLNRIASWDESGQVTGSFDEPNSARIARETLETQE